MKIYGYSERGAMNALFYGMAHDKENGESDMQRFLELAGITETFTDFKLYSEFSLSEFGNPDMMIIAKDNNGKSVVLFIEAKASCCKNYKVEDQKNHHDGEGELNGYLTTNGHKDGHSSNLFFQLRLKHYFFEIRSSLFENDKNLELEIMRNNFFDDEKNGFSKYNEEQRDRFKLGRSGDRKIGENVVVERMVKELKECQRAYYIAIVPEQDSHHGVKTEEYGFTTHTITWEKIYFEFNKYVGETIDFNQNEGKKNKIVSQILNHPKEIKNGNEA